MDISGLTVITASDGIEALKIYKKQKDSIDAEAKGNVGKPYKMKDLAKTVRSVLDS